MRSDVEKEREREEKGVVFFLVLLRVAGSRRVVAFSTHRPVKICLWYTTPVAFVSLLGPEGATELSGIALNSRER